MRKTHKLVVIMLLVSIILPLANLTSVHATTDSAISMTIPDWAMTLFDTKAQNNKMLERAWQDYQDLDSAYQLADLETMEPGSLYNEVLETFSPGDDVEVVEFDGGDGTASISYVYRAEEGDLNPETAIEDWAQVDFYFVSDNLIYTGITTLSLAFVSDKLVSDQVHSDLVAENATVETIAEVENLELSGLGQILVDGEYAYGIGYPKEAEPLGEGGMLLIQNGEVTGESTAPFEALMTYSFSGYIYLMLVSQVDNQVFESGQ